MTTHRERPSMRKGEKAQTWISIAKKFQFRHFPLESKIMISYGNITNLVSPQASFNKNAHNILFKNLFISKSNSKL